jgi:hypothetical protein
MDRLLGKRLHLPRGQAKADPSATHMVAPLVALNNSSVGRIPVRLTTRTFGLYLGTLASIR